MTTDHYTDVYPVGILRDWQTGGFRKVRRRLGLYWRRRSYWYGYFAEHAECRHDVGSGWTKRAAVRRVAALCAEKQKSNS